MDVKKAVADAKGGAVEFRVEKAGHRSRRRRQGELHRRANPAERQSVRGSRSTKAKPSGAKGTFVKKVAIQLDDGPGRAPRSVDDERSPRLSFLNIEKRSASVPKGPGRFALARTVASSRAEAAMPAKKFLGGCLCGAARYRLSSAPMFVHCCHCTLCQRQTGSAFVINAMIEADRIEVTGEEPTPVTIPAEGSAHDVFRCAICQVGLWSRYGLRAKLRYLRVATLDHPAALTPRAHIFVKSKLPGSCWATTFHRSTAGTIATSSGRRTRSRGVRRSSSSAHTCSSHQPDDRTLRASAL